tara:strand:+ start:218 stop:448 length:231 start_codon:yes stop_codon:yes gene_type:complete
MVRRVLEQVRGSPNLMKDPISQVVLNTNEAEFELARQRKLARKQNIIEQEQLKQDVEVLKSDMGEIKSLLKQLVEK